MPFPQAAIYKGSGDINDAANFRGGTPDWQDLIQRGARSAYRPDT